MRGLASAGLQGRGVRERSMLGAHGAGSRHLWCWKPWKASARRSTGLGLRRASEHLRPGPAGVVHDGRTAVRRGSVGTRCLVLSLLPSAFRSRPEVETMLRCLM
jgi:hypothetical protein